MTQQALLSKATFTLSAFGDRCLRADNAAERRVALALVAKGKLVQLSYSYFRHA